MCEVTAHNFEEKYPQIINDLKSATFIAIDCEFSGLFDDTNKTSLFDSPESQFSKLQNSLEHYSIVQIGLSTFKFERDNIVTAASYTFYLKPAIIFKSQRVVWDIQSIDFLCQHNFNFNKVFYDGIGYLSKSDEAEAYYRIKDGRWSISEHHESMKKYFLKVSEWRGKAQVGGDLLLDVEESDQLVVYWLHMHIRKRYHDVWTFFPEKKNLILVKKFSKSKKKWISQTDDILNKKIFEHVLGFSRILKEIEKLRKPIVGHNVYFDLILIYQQFYDSSILEYKKFKKNIMEIFPHIYDTKYISFRLKKMLPKDNSWKSNMLSDLYKYLKEGKGATLVLRTAKIQHKNPDYENELNFHEAGFDSYCAGFCFIKMSYMFALWNEKKNMIEETGMEITSPWLMGAMSFMKNLVNSSKGKVNYIALDGDDPESFRPDYLYIQSRTSQPLNFSEITDSISKHCSIDVRPMSKHDGLVAVSNERDALEVFNVLKNNKNLKVTKYNPIKHSSLKWTILKVSMIAIFLCTLLFKKKKLI